MLEVLAAAVAVGVVVGLATGGRLRWVASARLRGLPLLVIGAAAEGVVGSEAIALHGWEATVLLLGGYACLAAFAAANLGRPGMGVILAGIALNAVPIALNSGMPVEGSAIVRAHIATAQDVPLLDFGTKRHLAGPADHLRVLDDRFPDWVTHRVLSLGDLVIGVGVGAVTAGLLHPATGRRRRRLRHGRSRRHGTGDVGTGGAATGPSEATGPADGTTTQVAAGNAVGGATGTSTGGATGATGAATGAAARAAVR
jgi:hypothetical protein